MTPFSELSPNQKADTFEFFSEGTHYHQKIPDSYSGTQLGTLPSDHDRRFVAGAKFFNYEHLGALRKGGEVSLFSKNQ